MTGHNFEEEGQWIVYPSLMVDLMEIMEIIS